MSVQDRTRDSRDDWPTPQWLVDKLAAEFGPFDLDPAASPDNAKAPRFCTEADDGLAQPWKGRVFLNPPYGGAVGKWVAKARDEVEAGNAELVVCLVPARPGTGWYEDACRRRLVRTLPGRPVWPRANFNSAIIVFGKLSGRHGTVTRKCPVCGELFWPARSDFKACSRRCRRALQRDRVSPVSRSSRAS